MATQKKTRLRAKSIKTRIETWNAKTLRLGFFRFKSKIHQNKD